MKGVKSRKEKEGAPEILNASLVHTRKRARTHFTFFGPLSHTYAPFLSHLS